MTDDPIYLDHNATTPLLPEVLDAMLPYLQAQFGNPSSVHALGRSARSAVEDARAKVAALLGCAPDEVVFTSGGTEACNLALRGAAEADPLKRRLVTSAIEHPAVAQPARWLERRGFALDRIGVDADGAVRADELEARLQPGTLWVSVMHANNETGALQPIREIAKLARARGALVHTDAAQSVGKVHVDVDELGVDLLTVAGHKLHAPKGVGALYVRRGTRVAPLLLGAGHERGLRPGTENVASLVGLGVAAHLAARRLAEGAEVTLRGLRDELWARLSERVPGVRRHGHATESLPNTLNLRFPGVRGSAVLERAPEILASTGAACHDGAEVPSGVLLAMGVDPEQALGAVRLSIACTTTSAEIDRAVDALTRAAHEAARTHG